MLDHILACTQAFVREHGEQPNVVFINPDHHKALLDLYPGLFVHEPYLQLSLRLVIVHSRELIYPYAAYVAGYSAYA